MYMHVSTFSNSDGGGTHRYQYVIALNYNMIRSEMLEGLRTV